MQFTCNEQVIGSNPIDGFMMLEFKNPIPVLVIAEKKKGYALYVTSGGTFDNDLWCVVLCDGGVIRHYTSNQILMQHNGTFDITKLT